MKRNDLVDNIFRKGSFLCVGLDTDIKKIPECITGTPAERVIAFNKAIIDATAQYCVAYKPNIAFYEALGADGWTALGATVDYIRTKYPEQFIIADAKRGDIGNTVTLAPYMGEDSVKPFLAYEGKWSIILALTSNASSSDFETVTDAHGVPMFERVIRRSRHWGSPVNTMYVVGATKAESLTQIREVAPRHFLLVPGVGAQGGSLEDVAKYGMIDECGLLVNSSRGIIYASNGTDFAEAAGAAAKELAGQMDAILRSI